MTVEYPIQNFAFPLCESYWLCSSGSFPEFLEL
jgi:hypothetical protein